jgi:hypothetical protein
MTESGTAREMPRYHCHKEVWALKIKAILNPNEGIPSEDNGERILTFSDDGAEAAAFLVSPDYMAKHNPEIGGYYVVYKDGYKSFSPAAAFEEGYTRV